MVVVAQGMNIEEKTTEDEILRNIGFRLRTNAQKDEWEKQNNTKQNCRANKKNLFCVERLQYVCLLCLTNEFAQYWNTFMKYAWSQPSNPSNLCNESEPVTDSRLAMVGEFTASTTAVILERLSLALKTPVSWPGEIWTELNHPYI